VEKIKVGIIGTGFTIGIAKPHINGYKQIEDCALTGLYDIVPGRARDFGEKHGLEIPVYDDFESFIAAVDAVSICTHNSDHVATAEKCLAAGKHVIIEKPLASTLEEAKKALEFEKKYPNQVSMVVFNYWEKPGIAQIKKFVDEGKLGKIFVFRYMLGGNRLGNKNVKLEWRMQKELSGGGALADFGCHMLELADYLAGPSMGKITSVGCFAETFITARDDGAGNLAKVSNDDAAVIIANTEGGCLCSITACRMQVPYECIEIIAEGGTISHVVNTNTMTTHFKPFNDAYGNNKPEVIEIPTFNFNESGQLGVLREFVHAIKTGERPKRNIEHGYFVQKLLDALERSLETKTLVEVL